MKKTILISMCGLLLIGGWIRSTPAAAAGDYDKADLQQDQKQADKFVERYGIIETLGPLAPVALSPFFGLACLSGTSILCDAGILPANDFLQGNEVLNNWLVFLLFAGLTVVTSVPKLVSVSKVFAEAVDRVETYAGIISYAVILLAAQQSAPQEDVVVYSAGFFTLTHNGLLACMAAVNIFVIASVRFFFELLVLISPIPTLDAIFECTNKGIAAVLACIYAFNPYLAFVLNIFIFLVCLVIFKWVNRRLRYLKAVLLEPILLGLVRKLLGRDTYDPDWKIKRQLARQLGDVELVVKAFPSRRLGKIKKKDRCYLVFGADALSLIRPHLLKPALIRNIEAGQIARDVQEGLTAYSVELTENGKPCELVFGRVYTEKLETIRTKLSDLKT
ncbi:MAG: hypothetical protein ISS71_00325 [Phycisphaerae bacterium]|nr:hypothetical protein [Phycisphaerae bacterium]